MFKERYQNPVLGDTIILKNMVYSSNMLADVHEIEKVEVFFLDPDQETEENPDGRVLVKTILGSEIQHPSPGEYRADLVTNETDFRIGSYIDRWSIKFEATDQRFGIVENNFNIYRDLWYNAPIPLIYNLGFTYSPHKMLSGSKKYLRVDIEVFAPDRTNMEKYYYYLETLAEVYIKMVLDEGPDYDPHVPANNVIFDWQPMSFRERTSAFYLLDTTRDPRPSKNGQPMPDGIYLVQFKGLLGETIHLSPNFRFQLFS